MATPKKEVEVQRLEALLRNSTGIYFTDFTGLNVEMMTGLRRRLREGSVVYRVVKNSLVSRAIMNVGLSEGETSLIGPTGVACTEHDPAFAAKILTAFAKENGRLRVKSGFVDRAVVTEAEVDELARLPSKKELLAQTLAAIQSPVASFLAYLIAPMQELIRTIEAAAEKRQEQTMGTEVAVPAADSPILQTEVAVPAPHPRILHSEENMAEATVESANLSGLVETLDKLRVFELNNLSKMLQERWGVTAAAPVVATGPGPQTPQAAEPVEEEKTEFDVVLTFTGDKKIQVIKVVRVITDLGLKEAKALVDEAPKPIKEGVSREEAERIKAQLEEVGATIEIR